MTRTLARFSCVVATLLAPLAVLPAAGEDLPRIRLERFIPKLDRPTEITHDPLGRLVVLEQPGRASFVRPDGTLVAPPLLDLSKKAFVEYECGLLGIAFHPKFTENGFFYVNYTAKAPNLKTFVSEFRMDPKSERVDPATERVLLTIDQPFANHNGGQIKFGPDGMLYVGTGDGGSAHDPHDNGQKTDTLLGKMLRIDVTPRQGYVVPKDNPFVGVPGYRPEIWATGLRNPWRFCFDQQTGLLWAADVGQDLWEEVHLIEKGGNYGWRIREGMHGLHPDPKSKAKLTDPIFEYSHNGTAASITGGYVYRGKKIPSLQGWYLCADYSTGRIYGVKYENGKVLAGGALVDPRDPARGNGQRATQPSSFGEDADGELFLCDANGPVYRIVAVEK